MSSESPFELLLRLHERALSSANKDADNQPIVFNGIAFEVGELKCVVAADAIAGAYPLPKILPVPGVQPWLMGLVNINGRIVNAIDLRCFLEHLSDQGDPTAQPNSAQDWKTVFGAQPMGTPNQMLLCHPSFVTSDQRPTRTLPIGLMVSGVIGARTFNASQLDETLPLLGHLAPIFSGRAAEFSVLDIASIAASENFNNVAA